MILKCIALLAGALMLTNCCTSGNGCAPVAGRQVAREQLGTVPTEVAQLPEPRKPARAKREIIVGPLNAAPGGRDNKVQLTDQWEQQQAADHDDEARLKRKLVICRGCAPSETAREDGADAHR
jgi:hypothetical protein